MIRTYQTSAGLELCSPFSRTPDPAEVERANTMHPGTQLSGFYQCRRAISGGLGSGASQSPSNTTLPSTSTALSLSSSLSHGEPILAGSASSTNPHVTLETPPLSDLASAAEDVVPN